MRSILPAKEPCLPPCLSATPNAMHVCSRRAALSLLSLTGLVYEASASSRNSTGWAAVSSSSDTELLRQQYNSYADNYDGLDGGFAADVFGFPVLRSQLLANAQGDVLEVGAGTGLNLQYYAPQQLTSLTTIDLSEGMLRRLKDRVKNLNSLQAAVPLSITQADVQLQVLPFPKASFDTVVDTFSLCVYADPLAALRSMASMVRPGGKVLLLEHARSDVPGVGWYQDLTAPVVSSMGKGCLWNQDVIQLVEQAGMRIVQLESHLGGLIVSVQAEPVML